MASNHIALLNNQFFSALLPENKNGEAVPSETASPKKKMASNHIAPLNNLPLLHFCPGGVRPELVVRRLPGQR